MIASVCSFTKHLKNLSMVPAMISNSHVAVRGGVLKAITIHQRLPLLYNSQSFYGDNKRDDKKDNTKPQHKDEKNSFGYGQQEKNLKDQKTDSAWDANKTKEKVDKDLQHKTEAQHLWKNTTGKNGEEIKNPSAQKETKEEHQYSGVTQKDPKAGTCGQKEGSKNDSEKNKTHSDKDKACSSDKDNQKDDEKCTSEKKEDKRDKMEHKDKKDSKESKDSQDKEHKEKDNKDKNQKESKEKENKEKENKEKENKEKQSKDLKEKENKDKEHKIKY